jgi:hypothetical protein
MSGVTLPPDRYASTATPGWYPDPHALGVQRWFDGVRWTAHVHPEPAAYPAAMAPYAAAPYGVSPHGRPAAGRAPLGIEYWLVPVGRPWQSVLAPWVALGAFFLGPLSVVAGIAAIALAVVALRLPRDPAHPGRGRPVTAIVLGSLAVLSGLGWLLLMGI